MLSSKSSYVHAMPDYSSQQYWQKRLLNEDSDGFEWLVSSEDILPHLAGVFDHDRLRLPARILHLGCGSSTLGADIQRRFGARSEVYDADFALSDAQRSYLSRAEEPTLRELPVLHINALSLSDLLRTQPEGGWDILVDKSTADAISCGEPLPDDSDHAPSDTSEPIELLCVNLSKVTRPHAVWLCVSYSSNRFDFLSSAEKRFGWRVRSKSPVSRPSHQKPGDVVHRPETCTWAWLLERT